MIYDRLDNIPLNRFIDVYLGDTDKITDGEALAIEKKKEIAAKLINEYSSIVSGKSVGIEISKKNEISNLKAKILCIEGCKVLMQEKKYSSVCEILSVFGYSLKEDNIEGIERRTNALAANLAMNYKTAMLKEEESKSKDRGEGVTRDSFTREKVAIMTHYKMNIDGDKIMAAEYAYMVKNMCDEADAIKRLRNH
ncbi:hypothetical protein EZS27_003889 [termite gut metagenome]|uniref:Uncharacterized protein n=1 Tax=termite gut metagenome TaxID=433724 RepID=A0A5J4SRD0_9ZZZZ